MQSKRTYPTIFQVYVTFLGSAKTNSSTAWADDIELTNELVDGYCFA